MSIIDNRFEDKWGLVFSGGGGKGAYEIGVWKALNEKNIFPIGGVSGTSVGALNAAMFASIEYDRAEKIWMNISNDKILSRKSIIDASESKEFLKAISSMLSDRINNTDKIYVDLSQEINDYINMCYDAGMFSRNGLKEIIQESKALENLTEKTLPCFATSYNKTKLCVEYFRLNFLSSMITEKVLLASSAIPFVFGEERIGEYRYCDGGVGDNTPIKPLYDLGIRSFIVVHLNNKIVSTKEFSDAKVIHIYPKENLGNFIDGTLDFNPENTQKRIQNGYEDMKSLIKEMDERGIDAILEDSNHANSSCIGDTLDILENVKNCLRQKADLTKELSSSAIENAQIIISEISNGINKIHDEIDTLYFSDKSV